MDEGIVELYAEHLSRKAASIVVTMAVGGAIGGAVLGTIPGLLSHSVIAPGANYFAVLIGAIAGGFLGRSMGEKRAVGYRLQAKLALHQAEATRRIAPVAARPAAPAPAPVAPAAPVGSRRRSPRPARARASRRSWHPRSAGGTGGSAARRPGTRFRSCTAPVAVPEPAPAPVRVARSRTDARDARHGRAALAAAGSARRRGACARAPTCRTRAAAAARHPERPAARRARAGDAAALLVRQLYGFRAFAAARRCVVGIEALERVGDAQRDCSRQCLDLPALAVSRARAGRAAC